MVRLTASLNKEEFKKIKMLKQGLGLKTDQDAIKYCLSQMSYAPQITIAQSDGFYSIQGVVYRDGLYTADISKQLLEFSGVKTQKEWAEYSKLAKENNRFFTPDFPLFYSILKAAYSSIDTKTKEDLRKTIKKLSREHVLTTLSSPVYKPNGLDEIIHNFNMEGRYSNKLNLVGPDGWVKDSNNNFCQYLLGAKDNNHQINSVFKWLNETDAYIWRLNQKPEKIEKRVAGFNAYSGGAYLNCNWNPSFSYSSLGVRLEKFSTGKEGKK